jgi:hypothetical protein
MLRAATRLADMSVQVWLGLDSDDDSDYFQAVLAVDGIDPDCLATVRGNRMSLSGWTNMLARHALESANPPRYLVSMGDDHLCRTTGWDRVLADAIARLPGGEGWAYGNDLFQGVAKPTCWMVSAGVTRALGWMMLPELEHMFVDDAVKTLGDATGRIAYLPNVIIEHMHPGVGKAKLDDSYRESNAVERYERDRVAYERWLEAGGLQAAVASLDSLTEEATP